MKNIINFLNKQKHPLPLWRWLGGGLLWRGLCIAFLFFTLNICAFVQDNLDVLWKKNFGGSSDDVYNSVIEVSDGIIAVGYSESFGDGDWEGVTGKGERDAIIVKYNHDGSVAWKKNFGGSGEDRYNSVTEVSDGMIAIGYSYINIYGGNKDWEGVYGKGGYDGIIVKYNHNGDVVWKKNFGGSENDYFNSVTSVSDGIIAVGYSRFESFENNDWSEITGKGGVDAIIVKYNHNGDVIWKKNFGGESEDKYNSVTSVPDGIIAVGYSKFESFENNDWSGISGKGGVDAIIVKYNHNGDVEWKKNFGCSSEDEYNSITEVSDGIIAVGYSGKYEEWPSDGDWEGVIGKGAQDAIIVKYNHDGSVAWKKNFGGSYVDYYNSVTAVSDGIIAVGYAYFYEWSGGDGDWEGVTGKGGVDAIIVKYNHDGSVAWKKNFGGSDWDEFHSVTTVSDGIISVGYSYPNSFGNEDWASFTGKGGYDAVIVRYGIIPITNVTTNLPSEITTTNIPFVIEATVEPSDATYQNIVWSIANVGGTGASIIEGNKLNATTSGTATVRATITKGLANGKAYTKDFNVNIVVPVTNITTNIPGEITTDLLPLAIIGTVAPTNATNKTIVWSISNAGGTGATITGGNNFNATTSGTATIRATITNGLGTRTNYTKDFNINVVIKVSNITTNVPEEITTDLLPLAITGTVLPSNATNKTIVWSISNAGGTGATITGGNNFNATASGTATIRATITNGLGTGTNYTQDFSVNIVIKVTNITTNIPSDITTDLLPLAITGTVAPTNATNKTIVWSISNAGGTGATITGGNNFNATTSGTATIRATITNGLGTGTNYTKDFNINIVIKVTNITSNIPSEITTDLLPLAITGTVLPSNATNKTIVWSIENAGDTGATITGGNNFSASSSGISTIRATITNGLGTGTNYTQDFNINVVIRVSNITTNIPEEITTDLLPLAITGTVAPTNATNKSIVWSILDAGGTGATISGGNSFNTTSSGTATIRATITNGLGTGSNYTQDFSVNIVIKVTNITTNIPSDITTDLLPLAITGTVVPSNATNKTIVWSILNAGSTGATITGANSFNATSSGTATIRATITNGLGTGSNYTQDFNINVVIKVSNITTNIPEEITTDLLPLAITGTVVPSNATNKTIDWSIENDGGTGATISGGNNFNATTSGTATIRATITNGLGTGTNYTQDFNINVVIRVSNITTNIPEEITTDLLPLAITGIVAPTNATNKSIVWSILDAGGTGATISGGNNFNATASGTATIRATITNGLGTGTNYTQDFNINIVIKVSNITTNIPEEITTDLLPLAITGTVAPSNATNNTIVWSISNAGGTGATIIGGNSFNATSSGTATIRATITNGLGTGTNYTQDFNIYIIVKVSNITTNIPEEITTDLLPLAITGTVVPSNATNKTIVWSILYAGGTGATISGGNSFNATSSGITTIRATITNGLGTGTNYTQDFNINIVIKVTNITTNIPSEITTDLLPLLITGTVAPNNSTHKTIVWSIENAGGTGATITEDNSFNATNSGTATIRATITNGLKTGTDYTQDFNINIVVPVMNLITNIPEEITTNFLPLEIISTIEPDNATNKTIIWSIENEGETGAYIECNLFNAINSGVATVKATIINGLGTGQNYSKEFDINVIVPVSNITNVPESAKLSTPLLLTGTVEPSNATNQTIIFSIVNAGSTGATITNNVLNATSDGNITVKATIINGLCTGSNYTQEFDILIVHIPVTDIVDAPTEALIGIDLPLTATVVPSDASFKNIVWSVIKIEGAVDASIVDSKLIVMKPGTVTILATINNGKQMGVIFERNFYITAREPHKDATLKSLSVNNGYLLPSFAANIADYNVNVSNSVTSISVTGEANEPHATVAGNVIDKELSIGINKINITVTAEDKTTTETYTVTVFRSSTEDEPLLSNIEPVSGCRLFPAFSPEITSYRLFFDCGFSEVSVRFTPVSSFVIIKVNDNELDNNISVFSMAQPGVQSVTLKAEEGLESTSYTLNLIRPFENAVTPVWDNVLCVINNPINNGGYNFTKFQWYSDRLLENILANETSQSIKVEDNTNTNYTVWLITDSNIESYGCLWSSSEQSKTLKIYPNPANTIVTVEIEPVSENFLVELRDLNGKLILKMNTSQSRFEIDISDLPTGVYLMTVDGESVRVIKN